MAKKQFIGQMAGAMENNEGYMLSAARNYLYYNRVETIDSIRRKIREGSSRFDRSSPDGVRWESQIEIEVDGQRMTSNAT